MDSSGSSGISDGGSSRASDIGSDRLSGIGANDNDFDFTLDLYPVDYHDQRVTLNDSLIDNDEFDSPATITPTIQDDDDWCAATGQFDDIDL